MISASRGSGVAGFELALAALGEALLNYGPPEASPLKTVWFTPARRHRLGFFMR